MPDVKKPALEPLAFSNHMYPLSWIRVKRETHYDSIEVRLKYTATPA